MADESKMKVILNFSMAGPHGNYYPNSVIELPSEEAERLIKDAQAVPAPAGATITPLRVSNEENMELENGF